MDLARSGWRLSLRRVLILMTLAVALLAVVALGGSGSANASLTRISGPAGYTFCAHEGQACSVSGVADVAFGADGKFNYKAGVSGSIPCTDEEFNDPDYGVVKACYTAPHTGPAGYSFCAHEGQACSVSGAADVAFGADGKFNYKAGVSGSIACTDAVFGNPDPGVAKACYISPILDPGRGYSFCALEGQTCSVTGVATVAFGADGKYHYKYGVSGSIACTDAVFGDPDYGVFKACYTKPACTRTGATLQAKNGARAVMKAGLAAGTGHLRRHPSSRRRKDPRQA